MGECLMRPLLAVSGLLFQRFAEKLTAALPCKAQKLYRSHGIADDAMLDTLLMKIHKVTFR